MISISKSGERDRDRAPLSSLAVINRFVLRGKGKVLGSSMSAGIMITWPRGFKIKKTREVREGKRASERG